MSQQPSKQACCSTAHSFRHFPSEYIVLVWLVCHDNGLFVSPTRNNMQSDLWTVCSAHANCCRFYCEEALTVPAYPLSPLPLYCIPEATTLQGFKVSSASATCQGMQRSSTAPAAAFAQYNSACISILRSHAPAAHARMCLCATLSQRQPYHPCMATFG